MTTASSAELVPPGELPGRRNRPPLGLVWVLFFVYAGFVAVLVQTLMPRLAPAWHDGHGLLRGTDGPVFHRRAAQRADEIRRAGWSSWQLRPGAEFPVSVASAVYGVSVDEPWTLIPLNAAVHATGGVLLVWIVEEFARRRRSAAWAAVPFVVYPSAAMWYAQLHRDGWAILGLYATVLGWLALVRGPTRIGPRERLAGMAWTLMGALLTWLTRPYLLQVFLGLAVVIALATTGVWWVRGWRGRATWRDAAVVGVACWAVVATLGWGTVKGTAAVRVGEGGTQGLDGELASGAARPEDEIDWRRSRWLPGPVDRRVRLLAQGRAGLLAQNRRAGSGSTVDAGVEFHSAGEVAAYLPRALTVALFAPFPSTWRTPGATVSGTAMRRVAGLEMLGIYAALTLVPYGVWRWRGRIETYVVLVLAVGVPALYAAVTANVGTLYRMRYGYIMLLVAFGIGAALVARSEQHAGPRALGEDHRGAVAAGG